MKRLDRLISAVDLGQSGPPRDRDSRPSGIVFESRERLHIVYGKDPAGLRQRAIVNLLTNEVTWFPVPAPLSAPPAEPLPVTSWSRDHVLLLETPQGQRELYPIAPMRRYIFEAREWPWLSDAAVSRLWTCKAAKS